MEILSRQEFSFSPVLDMVTQHGDEKVEEWKKKSGKKHDEAGNMGNEQMGFSGNLTFRQ